MQIFEFLPSIFPTFEISFVAVRPKFWPIGQKIHQKYSFTKKILTKIRPLHALKIQKVEPPSKKRPFWTGVRNLYVTYDSNFLRCEDSFGKICSKKHKKMENFGNSNIIILQIFSCFELYHKKQFNQIQ